MRTTKAQISLASVQPLASFCGCPGRFESILVANPEDRFSRDEAQFVFFLLDKFTEKKLKSQTIELLYISPVPAAFRV